MPENGQDLLSFFSITCSHEKALSISVCEQLLFSLLSSFPLGTSILHCKYYFVFSLFFSFQWHQRCKPVSSASLSGRL